MVLGKNFKVVLTNKRILVGNLIAFDKFMNICLQNCYELVENIKTCKNEECSVCTKKIKKWGIANIMGIDIENIQEMYTV
ncbi:hypothetical protein GVAV_002166 [Gurleya vavrai]